MTTAQQPLHSGFGPASTAEEVAAGVDLTGRVAIVTGGYSGIGLETVRVLRAAGAEVVVPARDTARAAAALEGIDGVEVAAMDLIDPVSVDAFADGFLASGRPLHLLVASAGIMATPLTRDARGYEAQFATNHLGHFQLVSRLRPALRAAGGARVVVVSSRGHRFSPSTSTTRTSSTPPTSRSSRTGGRSPPTPCSPSSWTGAAGRTACGPSPCTPAPSSTPGWRSTSPRTRSGPPVPSRRTARPYGTAPAS